MLRCLEIEDARDYIAGRSVEKEAAENEEIRDYGQVIMSKGREGHQIHLISIIGEVEGVPDIVGNIKVEAEIQYAQKRKSSDLFFFGDSFCKEEKRYKDKSENAAINVGKNIITAASDCGSQTCKMVCKEIIKIEI